MFYNPPNNGFKGHGRLNSGSGERVDNDSNERGVLLGKPLLEFALYLKKNRTLIRKKKCKSSNVSLPVYVNRESMAVQGMWGENGTSRRFLILWIVTLRFPQSAKLLMKPNDNNFLEKHFKT